MAISSQASAPRTPSSVCTEENAILPAELIREVVTSLDGNGSILALKRCALVSRQWNLEAKPLIFKEVTFHLENPRNTRLKVERLEAILDSNTTLSSHVHHLTIWIGVNSQMPILGNLASFVKRLSTLSSFTLAPVRPEEVTLSNHWWSRLSPASRSLFQHLAALPTLRALSLMGAYVPLSRYIHHPSLESLSIPVGITTQPSPHSLSSATPQTYAPLRSLSITLLNQDRDKEFWHVSVGTLRGLLKHHVPLFHNLTHLNLSVNVNLGDMDDLRKALEETKHSLTHLTCSLGWDPGDQFFWMEVFSDPVSQQSAIQEYSKLDLSNMKVLRSLQLEYDSPTSFDFKLTFPLIIASLRTVPWHQVDQLWLILNIRCLLEHPGSPHSSWTPHTYFHPLDELISYSLENKDGWTEVQLRINHDCDKCAEVDGGPAGDQSLEFLPLLHALSKKRRKVHLTCQYKRGPYTHTSNSDF